MKEHDWPITTAVTAVPLTAHSPLWWQSAIAFAGTCTLSEYFHLVYLVGYVAYRQYMCFVFDTHVYF